MFENLEAYHDSASYGVPHFLAILLYFSFKRKFQLAESGYPATAI